MGKIRFGLSNVHYAVFEDGHFGTPIALPGAVNMDLDTVGEKSTFYADNIPYAESSTNGGYTGSLEIADIPKDFQTDVLGFVKDQNGAILEDADAQSKPFALLYEISGNVDEQRFVFYNVTASRPKLSASTKQENADAKTATFDFTVGVHEFDGHNYVKAVLDTKDTGYDTFMSKVYEPKLTA